jgi:tetratricopeptide (TPR) repeat protein
MRKINGKLFLALLIGTVVLTAGVFAVHYFQYQRVARALLWQARHAEQEGQVARMARYLQRYLEFNPLDNAEKANLARAWAGESFAANLRARGGSIRLLDEVLTTQDDPELRRLLVTTAIGMLDFKMARDHLQHMLPWKEMDEAIKRETAHHLSKEALPQTLAQVDPARGELESCWGQILEQEKQTAQAMSCFRLAIRHAPEDHTSYVRLAYLLRRTLGVDPTRRQQAIDEADQTMKYLVEHNETAAEAYLARWRYRREFDLMAIREAGPRGQQIALEKAAEDVAQALRRKPESVEVLLAAADLERLRGRSSAEDPLSDPAARRAALKKHRDKAFAYLDKGLELVKRQAANGQTPGGTGEFQLLWHKGNLLLDDLEYLRAQASEDGREPETMDSMKDEIRSLIEQVRKSRVPAAADFVQGRLLSHERRWGEAASLFERARALMASQPDLACQADLYLGQCYERLEDHTQMFKAFERVAKWDPSSVPAMLGMAAARWAQGQHDEAAREYQLVVNQRRVPPRAWIDIARLEIQRQVQADKPNWSEAEKALDNAEKVNTARGQLEVTLLRTELLVRQGKPDRAREELEKAREKTPQEVDLWTALADLALRENDPEKARQVLEEAHTRIKDREVSLRLAEARFYLATKPVDVEKKLVELAQGYQQFPDSDQVRLLSGLADGLLRSGKSTAARKLWQQLTTLPKQKNDLRLRLLLFDLAMKDGDETGMARALEDIRSVEQRNGSYQRYGQALLLIWQARKLEPGDRQRERQLKQARQELDRVRTQRPSWPPVFLARAEIAELNGNMGEEIKELQEAVKNGESNVSTLRRLVVRLNQSGRESEAQHYLRMALRRARFDDDLNRLAIWMELRRGNPRKALELSSASLKRDTKDPQELLWLGRVLAAANKPDEALQKFDAAIEMAGNDPIPWVVKVQFLVSQKRKDEAMALIRQARHKLPPRQAPLALGQCYDTVGQPKQALDHYLLALSANPGDLVTVKSVAAAHLATGRTALAEPLLARIVDGKINNVPVADLTWAKQNLAMVLAGGTDYQRFTRALELVGLKLDSNGRLLREQTPDESTEGRRARARVLASQQAQSQFRRKAIELLEGLYNQGGLTPDDKFVLALLLDSEGRSHDSHRRLDELIQPPTRTPQYLAQYAMSLITQQKLPTDLDRARDMIGWLEDLEKAREVGPNGFASIELRARLLEAQKKGDESLALIRQHVSRPGARPEEVLLILGCLSRQKRYEEAFALCEQTWKEGNCAPEIVGGVSVSLLNVMSPLTDAQVAAVQKHLLHAMVKNPRSVVLKLHLAALYDKRGEYEKAADEYRAVLKVEPNNIVALNNLAWMLALRGGDRREALGYITKAVNGMGRRADLLDTRGLVYLKLENLSEAVADFEEATKEAPTPSRLFHLAWAYHKESNKTKAREILKQAKDKGLTVASLHPVEQKDCRDLLTAYGLR